MRLSACAIVMLAISVVARANEAPPNAVIGDRATLKSIISFGTPNENIKAYGVSSVLSRVDIFLPKAVKVDRVDAPGYEPLSFALSDGRCFTLHLATNGLSLRGVDVAAIPCSRLDPAHFLSTPPKAPPAAGLVYVGKAWDLTAWLDPKSKKTMLYQNRLGASPVLTTSMCVIGIGGIGSPDTPMTMVSLVGYVDRQLTVATAMLIIP